MKKWIGFTLALVMLLVALFLVPIYGAVGVYDNVIRLHVLANSDSEEDQALKLCVRDAILAECGEMLNGATSREEAEALVRAEMPHIKEVAKACLVSLGCEADVDVTLDYEEYPRRQYETVALPAGEYLSLRVRIGEAKGQNWWCVLFPPLCLSAASEASEEVCLAAGLTDGQYRLITDSKGADYKRRFKIVEAAKQILDK